MNILNYNLPKAHFHSLIELVKSGHIVYTNWHDTTKYEPSFGINHLENNDNLIVATASGPVINDEEKEERQEVQSEWR